MHNCSMQFIAAFRCASPEVIITMSSASARMMAFIYFHLVRKSLAKILNKLGKSTKSFGTPVMFLIDLLLIDMNELFSSVAIAYLR